MRSCALIVVLAIAPLACTDETVKLAAGNGLQGRTPNDHPPDLGDSGGPGGCTKPSADAGADCPTFATMWTKYFAPAAEWGCGKAGNCHAAGTNDPQPMTDQQTAYGLLTKYNKIKNVPYVNPNCIEEDQSAIVCNIASKPSQCSLGGAMPQGTPASAASLADLEKWVQCGAPP